MCKCILLVVDGTSSDRAMMEYVKPLVTLWQSRLILLHVENSEPRGRRGELHYPGATDAVEYMKKMQKEFQSADVSVELVLSYGEPVTEIKSQVQKKTCDLVVMNTQERKSVSEILFGTVFERVRQAIAVPALLFKSR